MTVIETSTGTKLSGEEAPKREELEAWLKEHPGYEVIEEENSDEETEVCTCTCIIINLLSQLHVLIVFNFSKFRK